MPLQKQQINCFGQVTVDSGNWRDDLRSSWFNFLVKTLGLPASVAFERSSVEIDGSFGNTYCDALESIGMQFADKCILDLGCGLGTIAIEMAKRGGIVIGVEPCEAWRQIAIRRAMELTCCNKISIVAGNAEALPFDDSKFDYVTTLQVLEHVRRPEDAVKEIRRVLKSNGMVYVSCENYLAFREQHYRLFWLPLLPKTIGALYLKIMGRNPSFLLNNITYTTYPQLVWFFLRAGMWSTSWPETYRKYNTKLQYVLILYHHRKDIFKVGFQHLFMVLK